MVARALVVDDSGFFRRRVTEILNADPRIEVVGSAANGAEAVSKALQLRPDVITMDVEMPIMDGITAVRHIMQRAPTPVLMFSSMTTEGAQATLDALEAGAVDFLPKRFEDISADRDEARRVLCARVRLLAARGLKRGTAELARQATAVGAHAAVRATRAAAPSFDGSLPAEHKGHAQIVVIGTSTGGPVALQEILTRLPGNFPLPIVLVQHMPASFTSAFARRLDGLCKISVREAADGDALAPGLALLAPGGRQLVFERQGRQVAVRVVEAAPGQNYKPSVDVTFESAARIYADRTLAVVLTGMGADGREGARALKRTGAQVWAQDEASCVVYGMPAAVVEAGLADHEFALIDMSAALLEAV